MTPELQKVLEEWLKVALATTQNVAGEIPAMLWERVLLGRIYDTTMAGLLVIGTPLIGKVVWKKAAKMEDGTRHYAEMPMRQMARSTVLVVSGIAMGIGVFDVLPRALTAWIAPRVYIMEWLKGLL